MSSCKDVLVLARWSGMPQSLLDMANMHLVAQAHIMLRQLKAPPPLISVLLARLGEKLLHSWAYVRACPAEMHLAHCL